MLNQNIISVGMQEVKETLWTSFRLLKIVWVIDYRLFLLSAVATVIPGIIPYINIYIYKLIIDLIVAVISGITSNISQLYLLLGFRIITFFVQDAAFRTQDFVERLLWTKVPIELDQLVLGKVSSLDIQYFENSKFTDLLEKVRQNYHFRPQNQITYSFYGVQSLTQVLIALVAIAKLNLILLFLILIVAVPEFIFQTRQSKLSWAIWEENTKFRKRFWYLSHILQHPYWVKEVRIFKLAHNFLKEIKSLQLKFYLENKQLAKKNLFLGFTFNGLATLVFIGTEIYVIILALSKKVTIGDIGFYTGVVSNFQNGLGGLFKNINGIFENSLYVKSIFQVLDAEPIVKEDPNPVKIKNNKAPLIEFKNVDFVYPDTNQKILRNFSLTINPGEKIAFVGENGAGKSTIIKLLVRFYDVNKGEILINRVNIKRLSLSEWYKKIGVLFQDFNHYEHTAKENIQFGDIEKEENLQAVISAAVSSGAHQIIKRLDLQYEQKLGRDWDEGAELSAGQWQKIALARAFFRNAPVLILDEPTASIDAKAESEIFNRVEKLSQDKTVIIISHRFSTVRNADKIYVIDNGKIVESGNHKKLMRLNGQYATLFNLQAKGYR